MQKLCLLLASAALVTAQVAEKANEHYKTPEARAEMIHGLGSPARSRSIQPAAIAASLGLEPGMAVADIGSGTGVLLPFLSKAVGSSGRVVAEDIFDDFLASARANAKAANLTNVGFVKGSEKNPNLAASSLDVAVTVDSYHHFDYPAQMLAGIRKALKPGGRFFIVEYYKRPGAMGPGGDPVNHIRLDRDDVVKEVEANGFKLVQTRDHVPGSQYMATFDLSPTPAR